MWSIFKSRERIEKEGNHYIMWCGIYEVIKEEKISTPIREIKKQIIQRLLERGIDAPIPDCNCYLCDYFHCKDCPLSY